MQPHTGQSSKILLEGTQDAWRDLAGPLVAVDFLQRLVDAAALLSGKAPSDIQLADKERFAALITPDTERLVTQFLLQRKDLCLPLSDKLRVDFPTLETHFEKAENRISSHSLPWEEGEPFTSCAAEWKRVLEIFKPTEAYLALLPKLWEQGERRAALEVMRKLSHSPDPYDVERVTESLLSWGAALLEKGQLSDDEVSTLLVPVQQSEYGLAYVRHELRGDLRELSFRQRLALENLKLQISFDRHVLARIAMRWNIDEKRRDELLDYVIEDHKNNNPVLTDFLRRIRSIPPTSRDERLALLRYLGSVNGSGGEVVGSTILSTLNDSLAYVLDWSGSGWEQLRNEVAPAIPESCFVFLPLICGRHRDSYKKFNDLFMRYPQSVNWMAEELENGCASAVLGHSYVWQAVRVCLDKIWTIDSIDDVEALASLLKTCAFISLAFEGLDEKKKEDQRSMAEEMGFTLLEPSPKLALLKVQQWVAPGMSQFLEKTGKNTVDTLVIERLRERWGTLEPLSVYMHRQSANSGSIFDIVAQHDEVIECLGSLIPLFDPPVYRRWNEWRYETPEGGKQLSTLNEKQSRIWRSNWISVAPWFDLAHPSKYAAWFTDDPFVLFQVGKYPRGNGACTTYDGGRYYGGTLLGYVTDAHQKSFFIVDVEKLSPPLRYLIDHGELRGEPLYAHASELLEASVARKILKVTRNQIGEPALLLAPTFTATSHGRSSVDWKLTDFIQSTLARSLSVSVYGRPDESLDSYEGLGGNIVKVAPRLGANERIQVPASRSPGGQCEKFDDKLWLSAQHGSYSITARRINGPSDDYIVRKKMG